MATISTGIAEVKFIFMKQGISRKTIDRIGAVPYSDGSWSHGERS
jgi:hypothetical protein